MILEDTLCDSGSYLSHLETRSPTKHLLLLLSRVGMTKMLGTPLLQNICSIPGEIASSPSRCLAIRVVRLKLHGAMIIAILVLMMHSIIAISMRWLGRIAVRWCRVCRTRRLIGRWWSDCSVRRPGVATISIAWISIRRNRWCMTVHAIWIRYWRWRQAVRVSI